MDSETTSRLFGYRRTVGREFVLEVRPLTELKWEYSVLKTRNRERLKYGVVGSLEEGKSVAEMVGRLFSERDRVVFGTDPWQPVPALANQAATQT